MTRTQALRMAKSNKARKLQDQRLALNPGMWKELGYDGRYGPLTRPGRLEDVKVYGP